MKLNFTVTKLLFTLSLSVLWSFSNAQTPVFINEIHYDNASTDAGEAIEIAAPAGTDLTGWSIVLYNGSNGSEYDTETLSGTITDQANGYGFLSISYPVNGIQNGGPDGIALVDASSNVIQFLSYEGSFTAVGGVADGLTSTDIGVAESSSTEIGFSLQLSGAGSDYEDFTWATEAVATFGAVNSSQTFGEAVINIVINEVDADNESTDAAEFIELYDGGAGNTPLDSLVIVLFNGSNNESYDAIDLDGYSTDENGYFVIGSALVTNVDLVAFTTNGIQNGADAVALYEADATDFSSGTTITTENLIDALVYDTDDSDDAELLVLLNEGEPQVNESANGAGTTESMQRSPNGEGGALNTSSYITAIPTPGISNNEVLPTAEIIINEVDADNPSTDDREFIELYDGGVGNTPLDGLIVVLFNGSNDLSYNTIDLASYSTDAEGYFVIGSDSVENVDLSAFTTNGIQNGADAVALYEADATAFPNGTAITTENLVDAIVYGTNDTDDAELLTLLNAGEPQVDESANDNSTTESMQRISNGSGGALNTSTYLTATPTPGAENEIVVPVADFVIINEVDVDNPSTDDAEFIELYDGGVGNTLLNGLVVVLFNGNGDASYNAIDLDGYSTDADGYFVIGSSSVANVDLAAFTSNGLQNGADAVALYTGDATDFPNGTIATTTNIIDALVYGTSDSDDTELLTLLNAGEPQVDENLNSNGTAESMQRLPNGEGGALNTSSYGVTTPTPGEVNGGGVVVTPDLITIAEARALADGNLVTVTGKLTVLDQLGGPAYLQDATGGIPVFDAALHANNLYEIGDSITITAERTSFSGQIQLGNISELTLIDSTAIPYEPIAITLSQLAAYEGLLITIVDATFPEEGNLLWGNTNFVLTDASGSGELRIDAEVTDLVAKAQPAICDVTGVVGNYLGTPQLLPRMLSDLPCATEFTPPAGSEPSATALDIVTWNIEWFGATGNGPSPEETQKDSVKAKIIELDADVYAFQEISNADLLTQLVSELTDYEVVFSSAVSYPQNNDPSSQKLAFVYKTSVINVVDTFALLSSIHPYYNGGDDSALTDFPDDDKSRFYASGRLPFMMVADVTINGALERMHFVNLHARANNSSDPQGRYDMRKYDVTVLKDSLDAYYGDENVVLLGDYNDDVDVTVADISSTLTSYEAFVNDTDNYSIKTASLSNSGFRSYVFRENMIDHITLSDELFDNYNSGSEIVHYEFYDGEYANTTSDHMPVSLSLSFEAPSYVQGLWFYALCSVEPAVERRWYLYNPNDFALKVDWLVKHSDEEGYIFAQPGENIFTTPAHSGNNLVFIEWTNHRGKTQKRANVSSAYYKCWWTNGRVAESELETETEEEIISSFQIFPNPANNQLNIFMPAFEGDASVKVFDLTGKVVYTQTVSAQKSQININQLKSGVYLIKASGNGFTFTERFVKK
ncbi:T9SS type A sorting domain-containing protein [Chondrinema litorale]|uniref:T9SS type A sorting domain-containing protein n=1 Tax=Chondrinema litorale TaxID=2994555 RepID=UPI002543276C|nr:T9SS type A sorting domain-containing protein [Chondrinema litorale]UZR98581.1 T9SS type A sorting domain-containing protein [Chondrinema litorale]